jgi:exodeoxyribonuclease VII small subunit
MGKQQEEKTFEQLLAEVEKIVASLQDGDVPLEEAMALYEKGFAMVREAQERLGRAKQKLEILKKPRAQEDNAQ